MKFFITSPWRNKNAVKNLAKTLTARGHVAYSFLDNGAGLCNGAPVCDEVKTFGRSMVDREDDPLIKDIFDSEKRKVLVLAVGAAIIVVLGFVTQTASAAPLNFTTAESITLSSPATTLTIATNSVADALTTNATSVLVTLSQTTGGSFTLLSPSYDLAIATSSSGGSATISCSGGVETASLSQGTGSTVYTITPPTQNCADASAPIITVSPTSTNITSNSAVIGWTTNIPADGTVSYGTTISYGATSADPTLVTAHSVLLSNLNAATLYHYAVASSEYGTSTTSGDNTFTTASVTTGGGGSYVVTVTQGANGTISPGTATDVSSGADATFTITPASGYQVANVVVDGASVGAVTSYSFPDVMANHTITASFSAIPVSTPLVVSSGGGGGGGGGGGNYSPYTVTINGGAPQTNSVNVTLALTALAGMNQMWISNDYSFATSTGTGWIPFQTTYPWTLTSGFGNKTVYVEFKNANLTASAGSAEASLTVGVGGGTGGTSVTTVTTTGGGTSGSSSAAQLQLLNTLIAQLRLLLQQALAQGMTLPPGAAQFLTGTTGTMFTRDLSLGSQGEDVRQLQIYLNAHGFPVAASGAGSLGNETTYFGPATQAALAAFQKSAGISPASGYFGPKTRASLIGGTAAAPTVSAPPTPIPTSSPLQASQPPMFIAIFPLTKDLSYGVTDPEVAALQTFLAEDSAIYPQGFVTGYYGSATEHAVQKFQLAENIPASGAVDVMTRVELNQLYLSGDKP